MTQKLFGFYSEKQAEVIRSNDLLNRVPGRMPISRRFDLYRRVDDGKDVEVTEVKYAATEADARARYPFTDGVCHGQVELRGVR